MIENISMYNGILHTQISDKYIIEGNFGGLIRMFFKNLSQFKKFTLKDPKDFDIQDFMSLLDSFENTKFYKSYDTEDSFDEFIYLEDLTLEEFRKLTK